MFGLAPRPHWRHQSAQVISLTVLLFLVMDPFGNLVPVNAFLSGVPAGVRRRVILRESLIAAGLLVAAAFGGRAVLDLLGLENPSLSISGGIVLFLIALGMLFPSRRVMDEECEGLPLVVPIAMPLIAGPSAISIVILFSQEHAGGVVALAVLAASAGSCLLLLASPWIYDFLGRRGSTALERLMGLLLIMLSVQMVLNGIDEYLNARG